MLKSVINSVTAAADQKKMSVVVVDFADLECEASAKSVTVCARREQ